MTTQVVATAPSEEEIRAAIAREWPSIDVVFEDGIGACQRLLEGLLDVENLRPSEQQRLDDLTFALEYPDAPRATATGQESEL